LTGVNLSDAGLSAVKLGGANLQGANLTRALNVTGDLLVGAKLCKTTMPDGRIDNSGC
jgi:uncharacterized protein YjbI with pentapeptide repeats